MEESQPVKVKLDFSAKRKREIAHNLIMRAVDDGTYWD